MQFLSNVSLFTQGEGRYSDREVSKPVIKLELNFIYRIKISSTFCYRH